MGRPLRIALQCDGDIARVTLSGELDLADVRRFEVVVAAACERADRCRVDLGGLAFVDSCGVRALLRARRRASERGVRLELANATPAVRRVLATSGVAHLLAA